MANWRRFTGAAGLVVGATAAAAGAVVAAERIAINRLRGRGGPGEEAFGSLRGLELTAEVADCPQSVIVDEVRNGVPMRMAILARAVRRAK